MSIWHELTNWYRHLLPKFPKAAIQEVVAAPADAAPPISGSDAQIAHLQTQPFSLLKRESSPHSRIKKLPLAAHAALQRCRKAAQRTKLLFARMADSTLI
ncbi:hypothetical protein [Tritonibacter scottomollicae]|uniref:hypothetical protein n=1 Tax=Tritonibacter scottomollicae TaxID=483013 RepID=UPI0010574816|nr:hypothetical protein [Tritonibacter scottomollicae]